MGVASEANLSEMSNKTFENVFMLNCDFAQRLHYYRTRWNWHGTAANNGMCGFIMVWLLINIKFKRLYGAAQSRITFRPACLNEINKNL